MTWQRALSGSFTSCVGMRNMHCLGPSYGTCHMAGGACLLGSLVLAHSCDKLVCQLCRQVF